MKKTLLSSLLAATFLHGAQEADVNEMRRQIDELTRTIETLNQKVQTLEQGTAKQEQVDELYGILDEVETKTFKDKISISPELRLRVDNFSYSDTHPAFSKDFHYEPLVSIRFRLNMVTEFTENMRFYARSVSSKSTQSHQRICTLSPMPKGIVSKVKDTEMVTEFDRAYFDYYVSDLGPVPLIFTAGLLPTTGGSSSNLIEGTPRKSVFPSIIFDSNIMGGILSADLSSGMGLEDAYLRFIMGKAYTLDEKHFYFQCNRENIGNLEDYGLFFEAGLPDLGKKSLLLVGANLAKKIKAKPRLGNDSVSGLSTPEQEALVNQYLAEFVPQEEMILGDVVNTSVGIEIQKVRGSDTDFFLHLAMSNPYPNGNEVDFSGQFGVYNTGEYVQGGLIDGQGYASFVGLRHHFPGFHNASVGAEFNHGSRYWWSATQGSEDVFNKLANRGDTYEVYANYPFNRFLDFRVGYMQVNEKFAGSGWHFAKNGDPIPKEGTQENFYLMLNGYF